MKTVEKISEGTHYTSVSVGQLAKLDEHVLQLAPGVEIPGKVFIGQALQSTGAEISFQSFAPGSETGFLHTHQTHEEIYLFVKGSGEFQVDGQIFPVTEGSVVRVATAGERSVRNHSDEPLIMICIQYKANTFGQEDAMDGVILQKKVSW